MEPCCVDVLVTMQDRIEASKWLKILLVASPFILLLPHAPHEQAAELIKDMAVEKAVEKITEGGKLPEIADAVRSVDVILRNRLHQDAILHYLTHHGTAARFWERMAAVYA